MKSTLEDYHFDYRFT